jgi:hypothetical protein
MKKLILFISLFAAIAGNTRAEQLIELREKFHQASGSKASAEVFLHAVENLHVSDNHLWMGYRGMAYMLWAKHEPNPLNKLACFNKGKALLDKAIQADSRNIELRYLRFCVQTNVPSFLLYSDKIGEDKSILLNGVGNLKDKDLKQRISTYINHYTNNN